jgi:hypothetical protein
VRVGARVPLGLPTPDLRPHPNPDPHPHPHPHTLSLSLSLTLTAPLNMPLTGARTGAVPPPEASGMPNERDLLRVRLRV